MIDSKTHFVEDPQDIILKTDLKNPIGILFIIEVTDVKVLEITIQVD